MSKKKYDGYRSYSYLKEGEDLGAMNFAHRARPTDVRRR
jgi:hypothetical protein